MPLPSDFIDRLKTANPIVDVFGTYVTLKRSGRDYVCCCPFHDEDTPSCYVHPGEEYFKCFGCNAGGDVITFDGGKYKGITGEVICGEVLIDGKELKDVSDVVMRDRELLSNDGLILISASINPRTKSVIVGPEIVAKGFSFAKDGEDMEKNIKQIFYLVSSKYLITKFINWAEFKNAIKTEVSHYVYKEIKRSPIIIPVLISTDIDAINLTKTNTQKEN